MMEQTLEERLTGQKNRLIGERPNLRIAITTFYKSDSGSGVLSAIRTLEQSFAGLGHEVRVFGPDMPGRVIKVPTNGSVNPIAYNRGEAVRIIREIEGEHDLTLVIEPGGPGLNGDLLDRIDRNKVGVVGVFHASRGNDSLGIVPTIYFLYAKISGKLDRRQSNVQKFVAVSEGAKRLMGKYLPEKFQECIIIPNPVDTDHFSPGESTYEHGPVGSLEGKVIFGNIARHGRGETRKGTHVFLQAFLEVVQDPKYANRTQAIIGGFGKLDGRSRKALKKINEIDSNLYTVTGKIPDKDLVQALRKMDILVATSLDQESFGYVPAEALSSGTGVVLSNISGYVNVIAGDASLTYAETQEIFTNYKDFKRGPGGVFFPAGNSSELAKLMKHVIDDESLRIELGKEGTLHISENFSANAVAGQYLETVIYPLLAEMPDTSNFKRRLPEYASNSGLMV